MSAFPNSPHLLKGGIVTIDPTTVAIQRITTLKYNPGTLTRTLQAQSLEPGAGANEFGACVEPEAPAVAVSGSTGRSASPTRRSKRLQHD